MSTTKKRTVYWSLGVTAVALALVPLTRAVAQQGAQQEPAAQANNGDFPPQVQISSQQDLQRIMDQLGMKEMRRGNSSQNPNDEATANPYPDLPDPLRMNNRQMVTTADEWWNIRRPEIVEYFDREVYGRLPEDIPPVTWEVTSVTEGMNGDIPIKTKQLVGHVDNSSYPLVEVNIQASVTTPANATGPVPVIVQFSGGGFGGFGRGRGGARGGGRGGIGGRGAGRGGAAPDGATPPGAGDGASIGPVDGLFFAQPQPPADGAAQPAQPGAAPGGRFGGRGQGGARAGGRGQRGRGGFGGGGPNWQTQLVAKGWGYASLNTGSVQADNGGGLTSGIIGLVNKGQLRDLDDWGVLRAWAWGASKVLDYFETDADVDAKQVGLEGHSRWGKATIVAMAYDQRFATAYVSSSGAGGAKLHRRAWGEFVENVAAANEYHWMAGNYVKYAGLLTWDDLPVDSHELVAMCAPRPVFLSAGAGGDEWVDAKGTFMAAAAAQPVYELLGKKTMGTNEFPGVDVALIDGDVAFKQHTSGHTDGPNWPVFIEFASRYLHAPGAGQAASAGGAQ